MPSRDEWALARAAFESGSTTVSDIARQLNVSHQAVSKRRGEEGWREPVDGALTPLSVPAQAELPAPGQSDGGSGTLIDWRLRRENEASMAGLVAAVARRRIIGMLADGVVIDPREMRAVLEVYRGMVLSAQLLVGDPTENVSVELSNEERAARIQSILTRAIDAQSRDASRNGDSGSVMPDVVSDVVQDDADESVDP